MSDFQLDVQNISFEYVCSLPFVDFADSKSIEQIPGIYIFYQSDREKIIWYVGQSRDTRSRVWSHNFKKLFMLLTISGALIKIAYIALPEWASDSLQVVEMSFIKKLSPVLNLTHKNGGSKRLQTELFDLSVNGSLDFSESIPRQNFFKVKRATNPDYPILGDLRLKSIRELKRDAAGVGVIRYSLMTKKELIEAIEKIQLELR